MKHTSKTILSLLLALVLACSLLPFGALAEEPGEPAGDAPPAEAPAEPQEATAYNLWIGGVQVTDENLSGTGWSYDPGSKTLTLTSAKLTEGYHEILNISGVICSDGIDLTLVLNGANEVGVDGVERGIWVYQGSLTIKGSGSLDIRGTANGFCAQNGITLESGTVTSTGENGWGVITNGTLTVNGGKLTAVTKAASTEAYSAICCKGFSLGAGMAVTEPDEWELAELLPGYYDFVKDGAAVKKVVIEKLSYTVTFLNDDGTELQSGKVEHGQTPSYTGETPTKDSTAQYTYTFAGWKDKDGKEYGLNDPLPAATGEATYRAFYSQALRKYTIKFVNDDGTELQSTEVEYGDAPSYTGATPTKESTVQYDYTFKGWTPAIKPVNGEATYTATYEATLRKYLIQFVNDDGTVLQSGEVEYGQTPAYTGETPTKESTVQYDYTFREWTPAIEPVGGEASYTAAYDATLRKYTVSFDSKGGSAVPEQIVEYGKTATEPDTDPTRSGYTFDCWCSDSACTQEYDFSTPVEGDVTIYAKWNQAPKYTVVSGGGKVYGKASGDEVKITVKRNPKDSECFKHFTGVEIDGKILTKDTDYTAEAGSTVVTLKPEYLGKLNSGRHIITINFDDGKATTGITIKAGSSGGSGRGGRSGNPETGDPSNPALWIGLMSLSALGLGAVAFGSRKARRSAR